MEHIFILSLVFLMYTYFGYPLYVYLFSKLAGRAIVKDASYTPNVSVILSVYNEAAHIEKKIKNLLGLKYPQDKLEILIGSDGSTDNTNNIVSGLTSDRVKAFLFEKRKGKVSVLNEILLHARGEIIVFCDARQEFDEHAIEELVTNFSDAHVGCVSGELIFDHVPKPFKSDAGMDSGLDNFTQEKKWNGISEGIGLYWNYEKFIRHCESKIHSMVGATGAIYAIRKSLYSPPPADTILDDVYIPLAIARKGYRCIWEPNSRAYDKPAYAPREEYRRKVRTLAGNYQIFFQFPDLLVPFVKPVNMGLLSHKLFRVIAPFFMVSLLLSNIIISENAYYALILLCQVFFYSLALAGKLTYRHIQKNVLSRSAVAAYMFCLMNFTALAGLYRFLFGKQAIAWEK